MGQDVNYFFCAGRTAGEGSIAGVIVHIRRGIGVLGRIPCVAGGRTYVAGTIAATLLAYRVLYYFIPLLLALLVCYLITGEPGGEKLRAAKRAGDGEISRRVSLSAQRIGK